MLILADHPLLAAEPAKDGSSFSAVPTTNTPHALLPVAAAQTTNPAAPALAEGTNAMKAAAITSMDALDDKHKLAIGDRLSFRIIEDEDEPQALTVFDSGELQLPYLDRFPAVDKTCRELAYLIKAALEKDLYYHATVIVAIDIMTRSRGKVYLSGEVNVRGPQEIPSDEVFTVSKAILRAGGFTLNANKVVEVTRKTAPGKPQEKPFTVDVGKVLEKGRTDLDRVLEPGDVIFIRGKTFHI
jgi:protein involved in polysaccharide export with SLBB domain